MNLERIDDLKDAENLQMCVRAQEIRSSATYNVVRHRSLVQREKQRKTLLHKHKRRSRKLQVATERRRTHWPMLRDAPFTVSYLLLNSYFWNEQVSMQVCLKMNRSRTGPHRLHLRLLDVSIAPDHTRPNHEQRTGEFRWRWIVRDKADVFRVMVARCKATQTHWRPALNNFKCSETSAETKHLKCLVLILYIIMLQQKPNTN